MSVPHVGEGRFWRRLAGCVTLFRHGDKSDGVFHPLSPVLAKIHRNLKTAFDPANILNPGRMDNF